MSEHYYRISTDKRWLRDGSNPQNIGGRSTDIEVIATSLYWAVRETYQINEVPASILNNLEILQAYLETGSQMIQNLIDQVSADLNPELDSEDE